MSSLHPIVKKLPWLNQSSKSKSQAQGPNIKMIVVGRGAKLPTGLLKTAPTFAKTKIKNKSSVVQWETSSSSVWLLQMQTVDPQSHYGMFSPSPFAMARDLVGTCFRQIISAEVKSFSLEHFGESKEERKIKIEW